MTLYRQKTFQDLYEGVLRRIKLPTSQADALAACKDFINSRYNEIAYRQKWRWRKERRDIKIEAKYSTGTISVVNGSREITGTSTAWDANKKGWWLRITGEDEAQEVVAINAITQVAILASEFIGTTNTEATYTMFKFEYGLFPDCEELDLAWHDKRNKPMELVSHREIIEAMARNPELEGQPIACSVSGFKNYQGQPLGSFLLGYDFLSSSTSKNLKLLVFPHIPDEDYILHISYMKKITPLDADADEPLIPVEKRQILVYGALADMFSRERRDETAAFWERKFGDELKTMENDSEFTDDRPRLMAGGVWRNNKRMLHPEDGDLGRYFDTTYTPYD